MYLIIELLILLRYEYTYNGIAYIYGLHIYIHMYIIYLVF